MSNNVVTIRGYMLHSPIGGPGYETGIGGWLYTGRAFLGGRHAFIAKEQPATIIREHIQKYHLRPVTDPPDYPECSTGALARGKLLSYPGGSYLEVRNIYFFRVALRLKKFPLNDLTLGGWLKAKDQALQMKVVGKVKLLALEALLSTGDAGEGGDHTVLFLKQDALETLEYFQQNAFQPFNATVGGRLLTLPGGSLIQASFACPDDEESG